MLDTLGAVASLEIFDDAMHAVRRGGRIVNIGGTVGKLPIDLKWLMDEQMQLIGSVWFTTAEGYEMVEMIRTAHRGSCRSSSTRPRGWTTSTRRSRASAAATAASATT